MARHLLDHVDLFGGVEPPTGQHDLTGVAVAGDRVADRVEEPRQIVAGQLGPEHAVHCTDAYLGAALRGGEALGARINRTGVHHEIGARLRKQLDESGDSQRHPVGIDAALESSRRLRAKVGAGGALADADQREPRHLERDRGGRVADLGVEATHDAAKADRQVTRHHR